MVAGIRPSIGFRQMPALYAADRAGHARVPIKTDPITVCQAYAPARFNLNLHKGVPGITGAYQIKFVVVVYTFAHDYGTVVKRMPVPDASGKTDGTDSLSGHAVHDCLGAA